MPQLIPEVSLGIKGIINSRKLGEGLAPKLPYLALINLGLASSLFHSTLKYWTQMCDEFSMLVATFIVFYQMLSFSQTMVTSRTLMMSLCGLILVVLIAQIITGESAVQQIVFTGMVYWLWHMCFKLIGSFDGEEGTRKRMKWMAISGIGTSYGTSQPPAAADLFSSFLCHGPCMLGNRLLRMRDAPMDSKNRRNALGSRV
jgi:dihydroceramidase